MSVRITLDLTPEVIAAIQKAGDDDSPLPSAARQALIDALPGGTQRITNEAKRKDIDSSDKHEAEEAAEMSASGGHIVAQADGKRKAAQVPPPKQRQTRSMPQSGNWQIFIKDPTGNTTTICNVGSYTTIDTVMAKFCEKNNLPGRGDLRIVFAGRHLELAPEDDGNQYQYLQKTLTDVSL